MRPSQFDFVFLQEAKKHQKNAICSEIGYHNIVSQDLPVGSVFQQKKQATQNNPVVPVGSVFQQKKQATQNNPVFPSEASGHPKNSRCGLNGEPCDPITPDEIRAIETIAECERIFVDNRKTYAKLKTFNHLLKKSAQLIRSTSPTPEEVADLWLSGCRFQAAHFLVKKLFNAVFGYFEDENNIDPTTASKVLMGYAQCAISMEPHLDHVHKLVSCVMVEDDNLNDFSRAVYALAKIVEWIQTGSKADVEHFDAVCNAIPQLDDFEEWACSQLEILATSKSTDAKGLASAVWAVEKLQYNCSNDCITVATSCIVANLNRLECSGVAEIIWALSVRKENNDYLRHALESLVAYVVTKMDEFKPRNLSNILLSRARSNVGCSVDVMLFTTACEKVAYDTAGDKIKRDRTGKVMFNWTPVDIGMYLSAFSKIMCKESWLAGCIDGMVPEPCIWAPVVASYMENHHWDFEVHTLANIIRNIGTLVTEARSPQMIQAVFSNWYINRIVDISLHVLASKGLKKITPFQHTILVTGLVQLTWRNDTVYLTATAKHITHLIQNDYFGTGQKFASRLTQILVAFASSAIREEDITELFTVAIPKFLACGSFPQDKAQLILQAIVTHSSRMQELPDHYVQALLLFEKSTGVTLLDEQSEDSEDDEDDQEEGPTFVNEGSTEDYFNRIPFHTRDP